MRCAALPLLFASALLSLPSPGRADTVYLKNGRSYEGVIAERTPQGVRVELGMGQIILADGQVLRVDKAPSAVAELQQRKAALAARPSTSGADWLELARWAKVHDLTTAARDAALHAADLEPRLAGLDALLRPTGLVFEEELGRWIPFEESMARRGLVRYDGEWITPEERQDRRAERERQRRIDAEEAAARRLADAATAMQRSEEMRARREEDRAAMAVTGWAAGSYLWPLSLPRYIVVSPGSHHRRSQAPDFDWSRFEARQPGSFLPPPGDPIVAPAVITPPPTHGHG